MIGDASTISRRMGADQAQRANDAWIRANGRPVDPALWRTPGQPQPRRTVRPAPGQRRRVGLRLGSGTGTGLVTGTGTDLL